MQAVILAAGRGTRMGALTESTPKPMLLLNGRPVLEYIFDSLPDSVDEIIVVVGYLGGVIQKHFGGVYIDKKILYVEQETLNGTAGALWAAQELIHGPFLVLNGDDMYEREDMEACFKYDWAVLVYKMDHLEGASVIFDANNVVTSIEENDARDRESGYANAALYFLQPTIFEYPLIPKRPGSSEFGLPQTIIAAGLPLVAVPATSWVRLTEPSDIQKAEEILAAR